MKSRVSAKACAIAALGSAIQAFGLYNIHSISGVTEGGILGLTLLLHHWFGISPALSSLVLNAACYILGAAVLGKSFIIMSAVAGGSFSAFYWLFEHFPPLWPGIADLPLLAALVITVVDALPVFGTGTILIPWALVLFLRGQTKTGVGLVVLYGAAALSRQALEPRLVGKQVGLNPVLTLLALYTGYRLLGVGGMIVFPITAMLLKQIWDHSGLQPEG